MNTEMFLNACAGMRTHTPEMVQKASRQITRALRKLKRDKLLKQIEAIELAECEKCGQGVEPKRLDDEGMCDLCREERGEQ